jgi:hypothetical protein
VDTEGIDFQLAEGGHIEGTVLDKAGNGVQGATVAILSDQGYWVDSVQVDPSGSYRSPRKDIPPGSYRVRTYSGWRDEAFPDVPCDPDCDLLSGSPVVVAIGETVSGIDFELNTPGRLQGTVRDANGDPVAGYLEVSVDGVYWQSLGEVGSSGQFVAGGPGYEVDEGLYYLVARNQDWIDTLWGDVPCQQGCDLSSANQVLIEDDSTVLGISICLGAGGFFGGTVRLDSKPLSYSYLNFWPIDEVQGPTFYLNTQANGKITSELIQPGLYYVFAPAQYGVDGTSMPELYNDTYCVEPCDFARATPIEIRPGETTLIDMNLEISNFFDGFESGSTSRWD